MLQFLEIDEPKEPARKIKSPKPKKKDVFPKIVDLKQPNTKQRSLESFFTVDASAKVPKPPVLEETITERRNPRRQSEGDALLETKRPLEENGVYPFLTSVY